MKIESINIDWNYGLGMYPISNFLRLSNNNKNVSIEHTYLSVPDNPADVIIYGEIEHNINDLLFVLAGLMFKGMFVSVACSGHNIPVVSTIPCNRKIIYTDFLFLRRNIENIGNELTEADILVLKFKSIVEIRNIRKLLIKYSINFWTLFGLVLLVNGTPTIWYIIQGDKNES